MYSKVKLDRLKPLIIISILFFVLVPLENIFELKSLIINSSNINKISINTLNYIPLLTLLYFFLNEIFHFLPKNIYSIKFSQKRNGIVFIKDFNLWLAVFETSSIKKIQKTEFTQLQYLKSFSLEYDIINFHLRIFLYSKTYKKLLKLIEESKPIIEIVLPGMAILNGEKIRKMLNNNKIFCINQKYFLKEHSEVLIPKLDCTKANSSSLSRLILAHNNLGTAKITNNIDSKCTQCYFLYSWDELSFFECLNDIFFSNIDPEKEYIWDVKDLQRIRLRYIIESKPKMSFQESVDGFLKIFPTNYVEKKHKKDIKNEFHPILDDIRTETSPENSAKLEKIHEFSGINQICFELCNISNDPKLSIDEKLKHCSRRSKFCRKLITSDNFSSVLRNIFNQEYDIQKIHLITELKNQLSYYQLVCILAHSAQMANEDISFKKILSILQILFEFDHKYHMEKKADKVTISPKVFYNNSFQHSSI